MENFLGCHSEWNLGSPGGWYCQRITQVIGKGNYGFMNARMIVAAVKPQRTPGCPSSGDNP